MDWITHIKKQKPNFLKLGFLIYKFMKPIKDEIIKTLTDHFYNLKKARMLNLENIKKIKNNNAK